MKIVRKFKDECYGRVMRKCVGLRPKLYSYEYDKEVYFDIDEEGDVVEVEKPTSTSTKRIVVANKNTGKGIKNNVREALTFDDCEQRLHRLTPLTKEMDSIRSDRHHLYSCKVDKIA